MPRPLSEGREEAMVLAEEKRLLLFCVDTTDFNSIAPFYQIQSLLMKKLVGISIVGLRVHAMTPSLPKNRTIARQKRKIWMNLPVMYLRGNKIQSITRYQQQIYTNKSPTQTSLPPKPPLRTHPLGGGSHAL
jgi:hypothetical protein